MNKKSVIPFIAGFVVLMGVSGSALATTSLNDSSVSGGWSEKEGNFQQVAPECRQLQKWLGCIMAGRSPTSGDSNGLHALLGGKTLIIIPGQEWKGLFQRI
ncbi:hypothetical protein [Paenibacillus rhizoplanae]|uniref:hypothetical protein n=1 Tax=Paenibacillus rhizoplanae TaxID=1917181 RepID=UPI00360EAA83